MFHINLGIGRSQSAIELSEKVETRSSSNELPVAFPKNADGYTKTTWDNFKEHNDEMGQLSQSNWDKYVLSLSSGGLGISLIVLKEVSGPSGLCMWMLLVAWGGWALSILLSLLSFVTSTMNFRRISKEISEMKWEDAPKGFFEKITKSFWDKWTGVFNWVSLITFIAGLIFFFLFTAFNLQFEKTNHANTTPSAKQKLQP